METRSGRNSGHNCHAKTNSRQADRSAITDPTSPASKVVSKHGDASSSSSTSPTQSPTQSPGQSPQPFSIRDDHSASFEQRVTQALDVIIAGQAALKNDMKTFKDDIAEALEFQSKDITELKEETVKMKTETENQWGYLFAHRKYIQRLTDDINKVERYTRKNNLRIVGLPEKEGENSLDIRMIVTDIFSTKFGMEYVEIERVHRDGKRYKGPGASRPRHVLVKLLRYSDKMKIFRGWRQCLKGEAYKIVDDLTKFDYEEKKRWSSEVTELYKNGKKLRFVNGVWRDNQGNLAPFYKGNISGVSLDPEMETASVPF